MAMYVKNNSNTNSNLANLKKQFLKSAQDERFDTNYVESLQKSESEQAHKTIRQYQCLITAIKIASKILFAINLRNVLSFLGATHMAPILDFFA